MRILFANKFAFARGGQERVVFDEISWLRGLGHETELFSTAHAENAEWRYSASFSKYREIGASGAPRLDAVLAMFWDRQAERALGSVIEDFKPDVVHFHGIHRHLSPSVLHAAHKAGVRTVMTLHDYWPICPANVLLRSGSEVCDSLSCGPLYTHAAMHRCVQGSFLRSALAAAELAWQRNRRAYESSLDALVSPSQFLKDTVVSQGFSAPRFDVVPNAVTVPSEPLSATESRAFLYAGRLSNEKGLSDLLLAAEKADVRLVVAGDGPLRHAVSGLPFVDYVGVLDSEHLLAARAATIAAVAPSIWYENASMAILESMACGRAVVATSIGGTPEILRHGADGLLVPPSDVPALAAALRRLSDAPKLAISMGVSARQRASERFSPERHCQDLLAVYQNRPADRRDS